MIIYVVVLLVLLILSEIENSNMSFSFWGYRVRMKTIVKICACGLVVLLTVFRAKSVGGDLVNYERTFEYWKELSLVEIFKVKNCDIGFVLLNWLVGKFSNNFYVLMIVVSLITLVITIAVIKKCSVNVSYSLFLYICIGQLGSLFSGIRQTLAVALVFYSINCLLENKRKLFYIFIILAVSIHRTAIVGIVLYWLIHEREKQYRYAKWLLLVTSIILIASVGIPLIISLYTINDYSALVVSGTGYKLLGFRIVLCIFFYNVSDKCECKREATNIMFKAYMIGTVLQILAIGFSLLTRLTTYFCVGVVVWLTNMIEAIQSEKMKLAYRLIVTTIAVLYWIYIYRNDTAGIMPYRFFWQ